MMDLGRRPPQALIDEGYRILTGEDMSPRSYNEMVAATAAVHADAQWREIPVREAIARRVREQLGSEKGSAAAESAPHTHDSH